MNESVVNRFLSVQEVPVTEAPVCAECAEAGEPRERSFAAGYNYYKLFWIFFIGCIIGVVLETVCSFMNTGVLENRAGLIYGPFNPVYGFGALIMTITIGRFTKLRDLWIFLSCMLIGGAFEYLCSLFQELSFGTVSWEYSGTQMNFGGRTNLMFAFFWGILGLLWTKDFLPRMSRLIERIPNKIGPKLTWVLTVLMLLNMIVSAAAVYRQSQRREQIPATNVVQRILDDTYPDEFLSKAYPSMMVVDSGEEGQ